ncbi:hypothetical protein ACOSQ4_004691 [Xanthoceras sorbifolium]
MTIRNQRFSLLKQPISSTLNQHLIDYPTPSNLRDSMPSEEDPQARAILGRGVSPSPLNPLKEGREVFLRNSSVSLIDWRGRRECKMPAK